ncbi:MAG: carbon storage regulator CsrA [Mariprofundaceae bacterium]
MLILTRKKDETIMIRNDVQVKVLGVSGNQVKIGIDAPREVRILRDELIEQDAVKETAPKDKDLT